MATYSISQMLQMAKTAGFSGPGQIEIVAHALVESSGNSNAYNSSSGAAGILQFLPSTASGVGLSNPYDAQASFNAAYKLSHNGTNFSDWTPYEPAGSYSSALSQVRQQAGSQPGSSSTSSTNPAGSGLLSGQQTDPWGIGQGIADSVGSIGSTFAGIGRNIQNSGTVLVGVLVLGLGAGILAWMFLQKTGAGEKIKKAAVTVAMVAPK